MDSAAGIYKNKFENSENVAPYLLALVDADNYVGGGGSGDDGPRGTSVENLRVWLRKVLYAKKLPGVCATKGGRVGVSVVFVCNKVTLRGVNSKANADRVEEIRDNFHGGERTIEEIVKFYSTFNNVSIVGAEVTPESADFVIRAMVLAALRPSDATTAEVQKYKASEKKVVGGVGFAACPEGIAGGLVPRGQNHVVVWTGDTNLKRSLTTAARAQAGFLKLRT